jgi:hypothetical protein
VFVDPDRGDAVEPVRIVDQKALPLGEYGIVGGVPRHGERFGDAGDGEVLDDQAFQSPPQAATGQLGSRLGGLAGVLPPHVAAAVAAVAAHRHLQGGWSPPERLVRQLTDHGPARDTMAATAMAPVVRFDDPACEHGPIRVQALTGHDETQLVKPAEHGQVRAAESGIPGSVVHVEVFQMGSVRTSILGRPRYLSRDRRAEHQPSSATPCFVKSHITIRGRVGVRLI